MQIDLIGVEVSQRKAQTQTSSIRLEASDWKKDFSGSFVQSLTRVTGVNAIEIGAGVAKPVVRGLGFQRMVVAENGMRHEGQPWGADHGLEMDAFQANA
ncbi:hypothetical protein RZS08_60910, partial [Arthrospira platensis SPKY1]|nr:hypothetical protein [Arthrospira platensis SPKY1]